MKQPRRKDSGFALLLVFLMAAIVSIMLYRELPRVAFQTQRQKEQILISRGEEYKHAIGLFLRANKNTRWPASLDELESFNGRRYLRHRYKDPMTGKDEWRLIHIANGILQDSVNNKKPTDKSTSGTGIVAEIPVMGTNPTGAPSANPASRRRASEGGSLIGPDGQPMQPPIGQGMPGQLGFGTTGNGQGIPGATGSTGAVNPSGGIPGLLGIPTAPTGSTGSQNQSGGGGLFGQSAPLMGGGSQVGSQPNAPGGQQLLPGQTSLPGANGAGQPGPNPLAQAAAAGMLQQILTSPRPGGLAGIQSAQPGSMGSGLAGVASNLDADSIMVYTEKTNYAQWEFIYDPAKYKPPPNPVQAAGPGGTPVGQMGSMPPNAAPGTPVSSMAGGNPGGGGIGGAFSSASSPGGFPGAATPFGGLGATGTPGAQGAAGVSGSTGGAGASAGSSGIDIRPGRR